MIQKLLPSTKNLGGYYDLIKDKGYLFAGAPAYPFHAQVREATAPIFYQILLGDLAPQEGLGPNGSRSRSNADRTWLPQVT